MPFRVATRTIPYGDGGITATVQAMIQLIHEGAQLPVVRDCAVAIAESAPRGRDAIEDGYLVAAAIRQWVADRWEFFDDPGNASVQDLLYGADAQLAVMGRLGQMRADCDDAAILIGALARASGLDVRVICVGFLTADAPFTHTWVELQPPLGAGVWLEGDITRRVPTIPVEHIGRVAAWRL